MKSHLEYLLSRAIEKTAKGEELETTDLPPLFLEPPKQKEFGDLASNIALVWAKQLRRPPRAVAEAIAKNIEDTEGILARVEIAGPGFLNFTLSPKFYYARLKELDTERELVPRFGGGEKVQVVLARLLDAAGFVIEREYYVNDAGNQMEKLGQSIYARYRELFGEKIDFPEDGYPGEYVKDVAAEAKQRWGDKYLSASQEQAVAFFRQYGGERLLEIIRADLAAFGISLDSFVSEKELRARGAVEQTLAQLAARGMLYDLDGARWFKSTAFGDDKDRPLVKSDGELTYFASDIAYHRDKLERGFAQLINVWGADHHGYVPRLKAGLTALGYDPERLRVVLVQLVQLTRGGEPVRMGKRSGEFVSLAEVVEEVGADAARFFFLMRKSDSHLDFDLELAKKESSENPVFYVQYAHARIASIFEQAHDKGAATLDRGVMLGHLAEPEELGIIKRLLQFAETVRDSVTELEPHRVAFYLLELAGEFHRYYN